MRDCHYDYLELIGTIENIERKLLENEFAGSMFGQRITLR